MMVPLKQLRLSNMLSHWETFENQATQEQCEGNPIIIVSSASLLIKKYSALKYFL